jgi:hypothetical protein
LFGLLQNRSGKDTPKSAQSCLAGGRRKKIRSDLLFDSARENQIAPFKTTSLHGKTILQRRSFIREIVILCLPRENYAPRQVNFATFQSRSLRFNSRSPHFDPQRCGAGPDRLILEHITPPKFSTATILKRSLRINGDRSDYWICGPPREVFAPIRFKVEAKKTISLRFKVSSLRFKIPRHVVKIFRASPDSTRAPNQHCADLGEIAALPIYQTPPRH